MITYWLLLTQINIFINYINQLHLLFFNNLLVYVLLVITSVGWFWIFYENQLVPSFT
jgi:hypothetical protein